MLFVLQERFLFLQFHCILFKFLKYFPFRIFYLAVHDSVQQKFQDNKMTRFIYIFIQKT